MVRNIVLIHVRYILAQHVGAALGPSENKGVLPIDNDSAHLCHR